MPGALRWYGLLLAVASLSAHAAVEPSDRTAMAQHAAEIAARGDWKPLWDGKTLKGWHEIGKGSWTIEDGAIVGRNRDSAADFGHLVSDGDYKDFVVRLKYRSTRGNSGLYFRIEEKGFSGVTGFQAEIDAANDAGGLYETNGRAWVIQPRPEDVKTWFKPQDWNEMTVYAVGGNVAVHVNGKPSAVLINDTGRTGGRFALQVHGGQNVEVMFKDVQIIAFDDLLPGPGMAGWRQPTGEWQNVGKAGKSTADDKQLVTEPGQGVIVNGAKGRTGNLFTEMQHGDVAAHVEFMVPRGSNSGVYFQGRYEIQILDSFSVQTPGHGDCGGIYQRWDDRRGAGKEGFEGHGPRVNASLPPGEWQSFDVIFQAPRFDASGKKIADAKFVKVFHNGRLVHENVAVTGPTRAAAFGDEKALGPIMLQGDHGPVAYRNLRVTPLGK